jgi:hypothetical protein
MYVMAAQAASDADVALHHIEALCRDTIRVADAMIHDRGLTRADTGAFCIYDASTFEDRTLVADFILGFWLDEEINPDSTAGTRMPESVQLRIKFDSADVPGMSQAYSMNVTRSDIFVPAFRGMTIIPMLALNHCAGVKIEVLNECVCGIHVLCAVITDVTARHTITASSSFLAAYDTRPSRRDCVSESVRSITRREVGDRTMRFPFSYMHYGEGDDDTHDGLHPTRALLVLPDMHGAIDRVMRDPAARQRSKHRHDAVFHELMQYCWHPTRMGVLSPVECEIETVA